MLLDILYAWVLINFLITGLGTSIEFLMSVPVCVHPRTGYIGD